MIHRSARSLLAAGCIVSIFSLTPGAIAAASEVPDQHCVVEVEATERGRLMTGTETCFASEAEAATFAASRGSGSTIGTHYTETGFGGSSITITGTCSGGTWIPHAAWNNNIEASLNHCGGSGTRFYDGASCGGVPHTITTSQSSLGTMNNRASCVRYG